jgi:hypothetical protein
MMKISIPATIEKVPSATFTVHWLYLGHLGRHETILSENQLCEKVKSKHSSLKSYCVFYYFARSEEDH